MRMRAGIVGCGEPQSRMQVVGCLNAGGFDRPADGVFPDSRLKTGVNLAAYLRTQGHEDAAQALSDEPGADTAPRFHRRRHRRRQW